MQLSIFMTTVYEWIAIQNCEGTQLQKYQFLHNIALIRERWGENAGDHQHLPRWPKFTSRDNSVFRLELILTSCQINKTKLFKDCLLKTSLGCNAVWGRALPDQLEGPPSAGGLPVPPVLLPSHFCCFVHWTHCPLRKVINHNYLLCWQSPSHSSAHSFSLSLDPSIPHCPPVLSLCFSCSTLEEINVAVKPFIYLECYHRRKGHRKPQLPCHKYGQPAWTFSPGLVTDSDRLLLMHVGNSLYNNVTFFFSCKQTPFCLWLLDLMQDGMWIIKYNIELDSSSIALSNFI